MSHTLMYVRLPVDNRFAAKHGGGHHIAAVAFEQRGNRMHIGYSVCLPEDRFDSAVFSPVLTAEMARMSLRASLNHRSERGARSFVVADSETFDERLARALSGFCHAIARNWRVSPTSVLASVSNTMQSEIRVLTASA